MKTTLIYPATKQHIAKYSEQEFHIVQESGEDYKKVTLPYVKNKALSNQVIYIYCVVQSWNITLRHFVWSQGRKINVPVHLIDRKKLIYIVHSSPDDVVALSLMQ